MRAIAAKHSTQLYASGSLSELALAAVAISYGTIAILARKRGSTAATIAVLFAVSFLLAEQTASVGITEVVVLMAPFALAMVFSPSGSGEQPNRPRLSATTGSRNS